ncbi:MAG: pilus assembly protein [Microbacteriaceae bacterium]|nr:pilus assembly protein [Microbacteriaceae bacterium]
MSLGAVRGERGSVTTEFAVLMPAVLLLLGLGLSAAQVSSRQLQLQDAAADAARVIARGEGVPAAERHLATLVPGAVLRGQTTGDMLCVLLSAPGAPRGLFAAVRLEARSCALDGGF